MSEMEGYHKVAAYMSVHGQLAIFRRFSRLNLLDLLYLQAEITRLEQRLIDVAEENKNADSAKDWYELCHSGQTQDQRQYLLTVEVREHLDNYNRKMLQQAEIMKLGHPNQYNLKFLRSWMSDSRKGNWPILGRDRDSWDDMTEDLIVLRQEPTQGRLSYFLKYTVIPFVYGHLGSDDTGDKEYSDTKLALVLELVGSLVASLMPIAAILALYFIKAELTRLFAIIGFTAGFYLAILLLTDGTRQVEIFMATSAYAAVLVVYISQG